MAKGSPRLGASPADSGFPGPAGRLFPIAFGLLLGLSLLKFGNPAIMEKFIVRPENTYELVLAPWPIRWGYILLVLVGVLGVFRLQWKLHIPSWAALLPVAWFGWQLVSATRTVDAELTRVTLAHLAACVLCFYLGLLALARCGRQSGFWIGLVSGLLLVMVSGLRQHFGGLADSREYFMTYVYPTLETVSPEYMKKISSNRIFATLFYPNTLAAALILLLPVVATIIYVRSADRFTLAARWFLTTIVLLAGLACLYWSGSKGGWLVMMAVMALAFLHWDRIPARVKWVSVILMLVAGLGAFFWTYAAFFSRGAPSVGARFDYWRAAVQNFLQHPVLGSGPGTFAIPYEALKAKESEMSRLVHNDYLQQATDSGFPGLLLFTAFVVTGLWLGYRKVRPAGLNPRESGTDAQQIQFAVWLGLFGWAIHSLMDFDLYVPAIGWTAFALLGWLLGHAEPRTNREALGN